MQVVTYFYYKNLTFTLTQFWFTFRTGFSGQRFYDDWFQSLYNVMFTALPVIVLGLFEKVCNCYILLLLNIYDATKSAYSLIVMVFLFCLLLLLYCVFRMSVLPSPRNILSYTRKE